MADLRTLVRDEMNRAGSPSYAFEDLGRRRDRKRRNQRITAGVVGIIIALLSLAMVVQAFRDAERPASEPRPSPPPRTPSPSPQTDPTSPQGIFADVGGRIVYGNLRLRTGGIFAVDPTRPNDPKGRILVSGRSGEPLGWSSDGSRLLIRRQVPDPNRDPVVDLDLFVLNADGTETRVTSSRDWISGSISPDGSQVVYAAGFDGHMYTVDAEGGEPRLLLTSARLLYNPTFSPDGTQIAYFDGGGDNSHSLRVMNADGSGVEILFDQAPAEVGHVRNLTWSPDGSRLAFSAQEGGIWIVGIDGSGLTKVIPDGVNAYWSPDGSRISYQSADPLSGALGALEIAAADGTQVQEFGYGESGPWNPLPLSGSRSPGARQRPSSRAAPFVCRGVLWAVAGVELLVHRARRKGPTGNQVARSKLIPRRKDVG